MRLRELRKANKLTMKNLGEMVGVTESAISQYETGKRSPDYETILKFAEIFGCSLDYILGRDDKAMSAYLTSREAPPQLSEGDQLILTRVKELQVDLQAINSPETQKEIKYSNSPEGQREYKDAMELARQQQKELNAKPPEEVIILSADREKKVTEIQANFFIKEKISTPDFSLSPAGQRIGYAYEKAPQREQSIVEQVLEPYIEDIDDIMYVKWRISEQAAAAGNGIYLGPETFTEYEVDESKLPHGAAFGVPINGDSMEPEYRDGEIAIISKDFPEVGQVGLFTYDGNGYIKKRGDGVLESLNPKYDDIPITDEVIINGRVIGVITWDDVRK